MPDRLLGNYCSANLFHRDNKRNTKSAQSLEKACVVLINFHQPPLRALRSTSLTGRARACARNIKQYD